MRLVSPVLAMRWALILPAIRLDFLESRFSVRIHAVWQISCNGESFFVDEIFPNSHNQDAGRVNNER